LAKLFEDSGKRTGSFLAANPAAFVVPHAGLTYSGTVAASAYRHLAAAPPERVVLLGFTHRGAAPGAWIPDIEGFATPLGAVPIDRETVAELTATGAFQLLPESALCDHSVEIQLPLLQKAAPEARIVPVYVSHLDADARLGLARVLAGLAQPGTIFLASSDFTHYGRSFSYQPFPVDEWVAERLQGLDDAAIDAAGSLSPELFLGTLRKSSSTVCGYEPVALLLETLRLLDGESELFQEKLDYRTSGEITGDFHHSVSYAALGYFPAASFELARDDQELLLESARHTLRHYLDTGKRKTIPPARRTPALERRAPLFVTLTMNGELRGCVGRRATQDPLFDAVPQVTLSSALEDSRFEPVSRDEREIDVEISVLTPMKRIADLSAFRVNEHGAVLDAGVHHGLLLPQVATERGWSAAQFFDALARKTAVRGEIYRDPATHVSVFRAQIIR
ncbi:MAG: AmmeMemoRadiSam system protein B, partial [Bryobacteraceae bacterium]